MLAAPAGLPCGKGVHRCSGGVDRSEDVGLIGGSHTGWSIRVSLDRHPTPHRRRVEVGASVRAERAGLAEWSYGRENNAGVRRGQSFVAQPKVVQVAGLEGFDDQVGRTDEFEERFFTGGRGDVDDRAALVGVVMEEAEAALRVDDVTRVRRHVSHRVALGWFDLDDVGTVVGEQAGGILARDSREIQDAQAVQRRS